MYSGIDTLALKRWAFILSVWNIIPYCINSLKIPPGNEGAIRPHHGEAEIEPCLR